MGTEGWYCGTIDAGASIKSITHFLLNAIAFQLLIFLLKNIERYGLVNYYSFIRRY